MQPHLLPSFARRRGRKLTAVRESLLDTLLPKLRIALPEGELEPGTLFPNPDAPLWFELGFGGGEHLVGQARQHPGINFIGCEPYMNGVAGLLSAIGRDNLTNIRLYDNDARALLQKLPDNSVERLFILFPDPWPKARHHKRRIISQASLALFYDRLKPGGLLRLATDHVDYCEWMREQLATFAKFIPSPKNESDYTAPPSDWVRTRYQAKAEAEGRGAAFLEWRK